MLLGKLKYSTTEEEGFVEIDWMTMPTDVVMLDILQDWILELQSVYETKLEKVFNKGETK